MKRVRPEDKKRYVLKEKRDYEILEKIYVLEEQPLSPQDREVVQLIRTQLEDEWREPLIKYLNELAEKYK
jgi:hypothetical protein